MQQGRITLSTPESGDVSNNIAAYDAEYLIKTMHHDSKVKPDIQV